MACVGVKKASRAFRVLIQNSATIQLPPPPGLALANNRARLFESRLTLIPDSKLTEVCVSLVQKLIQLPQGKEKSKSKLKGKHLLEKCLLISNYVADNGQFIKNLFSNIKVLLEHWQKNIK